MFTLAQAAHMTEVALSVRRASPTLRHFSVALNYHLDSQHNNPNVPCDFTELNKEQRVGISYQYLSRRAFSLSSGKVISKEEKAGQDAFMRSLNEKMNQMNLGKLGSKSVGKESSDLPSAKYHGAVPGNDTALLSRSEKKMVHNKKVYKLIEEYDQLLVCSADNVGPHQLQSIRQHLRPNSVVFLGKNAMMKTAIKAFAEKSGTIVYQNMIPLLVGNVALIFTKGGLIDAVVPPGNTVLELMKKGEKASSSEADLLAKLGILPLSHGLVVKAMYGNRSVFDPAVLDIVEEELKEKFSAVFSLWQPFLSLSTILH
ncbi:hypothetical protein SUGI_0577600 [Cryptomeria japonica]|nr:hypothetical protein SUGI_0577600 [Cryptomeria japonica]